MTQLRNTQVQTQNAISPGKVPSKSDSRKILRVEWRWVGVTWTLVLDQCSLVSSQLCFLGLLGRKMIPFSINLLKRSIEITMWIHPAHGRSFTGMTASLFIPSFKSLILDAFRNILISDPHFPATPQSKGWLRWDRPSSSYLLAP